MMWATEKTQPGAFCVCMFVLKTTLAIAFADLSNKLCCMMQKLAGILTFDSVHACPYLKTPRTVTQGHSQLCVSCTTCGPQSCAHADPNCWTHALAVTAVLAATAVCVSSSETLFRVGPRTQLWGKTSRLSLLHCCLGLQSHHSLAPSWVVELSKLQMLCSKTHFQHTMIMICCSFHTW